MTQARPIPISPVPGFKPGSNLAGSPRHPLSWKRGDYRMLDTVPRSTAIWHESASRLMARQIQALVCERCLNDVTVAAGTDRAHESRRAVGALSGQVVTTAVLGATLPGVSEAI
jgi:hypothetical protein